MTALVDSTPPLAGPVSSSGDSAGEKDNALKMNPTGGEILAQARVNASEIKKASIDEALASIERIPEVVQGSMEAAVTPLVEHIQLVSEKCCSQHEGSHARPRCHRLPG